MATARSASPSASASPWRARAATPPPNCCSAPTRRSTAPRRADATASTARWWRHCRYRWWSGRWAARRAAGARKRPLSARAATTDAGARAARLFHLRFLEDDVLACDRIVFLELELLGLGARVLLGHI